MGGAPFQGLGALCAAAAASPASMRCAFAPCADSCRLPMRLTGLADLGYVGCLALLYKFKRAGGRALTRPEVYFNNLHEHIRNRIENVVSQVKRHRLFQKGAYSGSMDHLVPLVKIVGHVTAYEIRKFGPRFVCYGPWAHN